MFGSRYYKIQIADPIPPDTAAAAVTSESMTNDFSLSSPIYLLLSSIPYSLPLLLLASVTHFPYLGTDRHITKAQKQTMSEREQLAAKIQKNLSYIPNTFDFSPISPSPLCHQFTLTTLSAFYGPFPSGSIRHTVSVRKCHQFLSTFLTATVPAPTTATTAAASTTATTTTTDLPSSMCKNWKEMWQLLNTCFFSSFSFARSVCVFQKFFFCVKIRKERTERRRVWEEEN